MIKTYYHTRLPHIQPVGSTFFVTFRLFNSLPIEVEKRLMEEYETNCRNIKQNFGKDYKKQIIIERKRYFSRFENALDFHAQIEWHLKIPEIAQIVSTKLHELAKQYYDLYAYTIMSNHVHVLFNFEKQLDNVPDDEIITEKNYTPLFKVMKLIKGSTAREANLLLKRTGNSFWHKDNYDHYVRNGKEFDNIIAYILNNPVKAGIVEDWEKYAFTYLQAGL